MSWLFYANVVIWIGIGTYVAFLGWRQRRIVFRLQQLENSSDE